MSEQELRRVSRTVRGLEAVGLLRNVYTSLLLFHLSIHSTTMIGTCISLEKTRQQRDSRDENWTSVDYHMFSNLVM